MGYRLTHNGYKVEFMDTLEEVEKYISDTLEKNNDLSPVEIYRSDNTDNKAEHQGKNGNVVYVSIWQYYTLYSEMFLVEER